MSAGWAEATVGEICKFRYGRALKAQDRSGTGWPVYGSNGIVGAHDAALTRGPTIVIGRKGSYGEIHYSATPVWPIDTTYFVDETCTSCDIKWLAYRLDGLGLTRLNRAAAVPGLNREDAYRLHLLVPPLAEQRRIARVLDAADRLRCARGRTLEIVARLRGAILNETLRTSQTRLQCFGDLLLRPLRNGLSPATTGQHPGVVLTLSALKGGSFDDMARKPCSFDRQPAPNQMATQGTFLISRGNGNLHLVGVGAVVPLDAPGVTFPDTMIGAQVDVEAVDPRYLEAAWASQAVRDQIERAATTTNGTFKINQAKLAAIEIPVPDSATQRRFASAAARVASQRQRLREHLVGLNDLFASLQHSAFNGEL